MNVIEQAKKIRAEMDDRAKREADIKALLNGLAERPGLAELLSFLRKIREVLKDA